MKLKIIEINGNQTIIDCKSFEFRANQISNWILIKNEDGQGKRIYQIATIKGGNENEMSHL